MNEWNENQQPGKGKKILPERLERKKSTPLPLTEPRKKQTERERREEAKVDAAPGKLRKGKQRT